MPQEPGRYPFTFHRSEFDKAIIWRCRDCGSEYAFVLMGGFNPHSVLYSRFGNCLYLISDYWTDVPEVKAEIERGLNAEPPALAWWNSFYGDEGDCPYCGTPFRTQDRRIGPAEITFIEFRSRD